MLIRLCGSWGIVLAAIVLAGPDSPPAGEVVRFLSQPAEPPTPGAVSVIDGQHVWVGLTYTADGGLSWVARCPPAMSGADFDLGAPCGVANTFFVTANRGWLTGTRSVWMTDDGGLTWRSQVPGRVYAMAFVGNRGWLAAGGAQSVQNYRTEDLGQTWNQCGSLWDLSQVGPWGSASFLDARNGWITVGSYGERGLPYRGGVARTADGGCTWKILWREPRPSGGMGDIRFVDNSFGWVIASFGTLLRTRDGGTHWSPVALPEPDFLQSAYLVSRSRGWIMGGTNEGSVLYYTTDAGAHWHSVSDEDIRANRGMAREIPVGWGEALVLSFQPRR
jgi:photosystem II stability/assembly factor-like uncharacterized protein